MSKYILGITGCPTGIAHTFMAKEGLEKAAKSLGYEIKVETNGQEGRKNEITDDDLRRADAIIVAADINVDAERFLELGIPFIQTNTKAVLSEQSAKKTIENALSVPAKGSKENIGKNDRVVKSEKSGAQGSSVYRDLMSGVSNMLPFVVSGGILIALSFLWGIYSSDPTNEQYNAFAAMLMKIGQQAFGIMVPVFTAYIAFSIAGRAGLVAGFVGGLLANETGAGFLGGIIAGFFAGYLMYYVGKLFSGFKREYEGLKSIFLMPLIGVFVTGMLMLWLGKPVASLNEFMMNWLSGLQGTNPIILGIVVGMMCSFDFGGPVNKAAYVTGTILLAQGNFYFMAGVSAACITPPLVIALATTIFKKGFSEDERAAGVVNYILGATHITEGAIPFAAKDPLRVIPIMMIASAISAVLSYMLLITVPAPHGGFLILPLVNKPLVWVGCILVGSFVGAVLLGTYRVRIAKKLGLVKAEDLTNEIDNAPVNKTMQSVAEIHFDNTNISIIKNPVNKPDVLKEIAQEMMEKGLVSEDYLPALLAREAQDNTYLEKGIAIPHGTKDFSDKVLKTGVVIKFIPHGVNWGNGEKTRLVVGIAANNQSHLTVLTKITTLLSDDEIENKLAQIETVKEVIQLLSGDYVLKTEIVKLPDEKNVKQSSDIDQSPNREEVECECEILNENGLHLRPATNFVKLIKSFENADIKIRKLAETKFSNAKSVMSVTKLGLKKGDKVVLSILSHEPEKIVKEIKKGFESKFGE